MHFSNHDMSSSPDHLAHLPLQSQLALGRNMFHDRTQTLPSKVAHPCVMVRGFGHGRNLPFGGPTHQIRRTRRQFRQTVNPTNKIRIRRLHHCWNFEGSPQVRETRIQHRWRLWCGLAGLTNTDLASAVVGGEKGGGGQG